MQHPVALIRTQRKKSVWARVTRADFWKAWNWAVKDVGGFARRVKDKDISVVRKEKNKNRRHNNWQ